MQELYGTKFYIYSRDINEDQKNLEVYYIQG